jgi:predicted RNA-binding protein with EMAP domain
MALVKNGCYVFNRVTMQRRFHTNNVSKRKIHNKEKRLQLLKSLERGHTTMKEYAEYLNPKDVVATEKIQESIECIQNRIKVIEKKSFSAMIKNLFLYRRYYPNFKSIFMDYYIAVRKE